MTKDKSILINNIYHMLSYAFQTLNQETYEDVAVESFDEMYNLLAAILSKGIGLQLKQGLYREYISRQEELSVMRGKINMPGTIKNRLAHKRELTCDFDELSENNLLNQILKTTVTLLLRNGKVQAKYKDDLKKKMLYFSNVEIIEPTERYFRMQAKSQQRLQRQKLRLNLKSIVSFRTDCSCLTLINTCWNWKRMRRSNRISSPFQCWIFRYDKVECMETWLSVRTKNSC